jgi:hypothetical protein
MLAIRPPARILAAAAVNVLFGTLAFGGGLTLNWVWVGPAINGVVPSGKATLDEPSLPGQLTTEVQNVNLPDGTTLLVSIDYYVVGSLNLFQGKAKLQTTVPFQVKTGPFEIMTTDYVTIMEGQWKN